MIPAGNSRVSTTLCCGLNMGNWQGLQHSPLFCSDRRVCSHAKSLNRRMTSLSFFLYCSSVVLVCILYETYACKRRHCQYRDPGQASGI